MADIFTALSKFGSSQFDAEAASGNPYYQNIQTDNLRTQNTPYIYDGDTSYDNGVGARALGIDTPEMLSKAESLARAKNEKLSKFSAGEVARFEAELNVGKYNLGEGINSGKDTFGRNLIENNAYKKDMIERGFAVPTYFGGENDIESARLLEEAQREKRGLWANPEYTKEMQGIVAKRMQGKDVPEEIRAVADYVTNKDKLNSLTFDDFAEYAKEKGDSGFIDGLQAFAMRQAAVPLAFAKGIAEGDISTDALKRNTEYIQTNADYLAGNDVDDIGFAENTRRALGSSVENVANKASALLGEGIQSIGEGIVGIKNLDKDFLAKENARLGQYYGESVPEWRETLVDSLRVEDVGSWLKDVGTGIQKDATEFAKANKNNDISGFDDRDVGALTAEIDKTIKEDGFISAFGKAITDVRSLQVLAQSIPEMMALAASVGGMAVVNANHNLNIAEDAKGAPLTSAEKVMSSATSIAATYLDRLGDKLALSGLNPAKVALKEAIETAPSAVKRALASQFGEAILKIGEAPLRLAGAALVEGATEYGQTLGEAAAQDVNVFKDGFTDAQLDEANVAGVLGAAMGGQMATPSVAKDTLKGSASLAKGAVEAINRDEVIEPVKSEGSVSRRDTAYKLRDADNVVDVLGSDADAVKNAKTVKDAVALLASEGALTDKVAAKLSAVMPEAVAEGQALGKDLSQLKKTSEDVSKEVREGARGFLTYYDAAKEAEFNGDDKALDANVAKLEGFISSQRAKLSAFADAENSVMAEWRAKAKGVDLATLYKEERKALAGKVGPKYDYTYGIDNRKANVPKIAVLEKEVSGNPDFNGSAYSYINKIKEEVAIMDRLHGDLVGGIVAEAEPTVVEAKEATAPMKAWITQSVEAGRDAETIKSRMTKLPDEYVESANKFMNDEIKRFEKVSKFEQSVPAMSATQLEKAKERLAKSTTIGKVGKDKITKAIEKREKELKDGNVSNDIPTPAVDTPKVEKAKPKSESVEKVEKAEEKEISDAEFDAIEDVKEEPNFDGIDTEEINFDTIIDETPNFDAIEESVMYFDAIAEDNAMAWESIEKTPITARAEVAEVTSKDVRKREIEKELQSINAKKTLTAEDKERRIELNKEFKEIKEALSKNENKFVKEKAKQRIHGKGFSSGRTFESVFKPTSLTGLSVVSEVEAKSEITEVSRALNDAKMTAKGEMALTMQDTPAQYFIRDANGNIDPRVAVALVAEKSNYVLNLSAMLGAMAIEELAERFTKVDEMDLTNIAGNATPYRFEAETIGASVLSSLGVGFNDNISMTYEAALKADLGTIVLKMLAAENKIEITGLRQNGSKGLVYAVSMNYETSLKSDSDKAKQYEAQYGIDYLGGRTFKMFKPSGFREVEIKNEPYTEASEEQAGVIRKLESMEYSLNEGYEILKEMYSPDELKAQMGYGKEFKTKTNIDAQASRDREIETHVDSLGELAQLKDENGNNASIWFNWFLSKNRRYNLDSTTINPQTVKLHRFLVTAKSATTKVDDTLLADIKAVSSKSKEAKMFKYALVQAFDGAAGVESIDKVHWNTVEARANKLMKMSKQELIILAKESPKLAHVGHTAVAIANIDKVQNGEAFESNLTVEFDGLTNGFAFSMLQFPQSGFKGWLDRIGMLLKGSKYYEVDSMAEVRSLGFLDTYESLNSEVKYPSVEIFKGKENKIQRDIYNTLLPDLSNTSVARSLMKGPVMIFNYGAGIAKIQENITDELLVDALEKLADNEELMLDLVVTEEVLKNRDIKSAEMKNVVDTISDVINTTYSIPIAEALGRVFQDRVELNKEMSGAFNEMYNEFITELGAIMATIQKGSILPSKKEMIDVVKSVIKEKGPIINGPTTLGLEDMILIGARAVMDIETLTGDTTNNSIESSAKGMPGAALVVRGLGKPGAAGNVIPIHAMDATTIGRAIVETKGGFLGVHDAMVLGINQADAVESYNKNWYELNRKYSVLDEVIKAADKAEVDTGKLRISAKAIDRNRKEIFETDAKVGQMIGMPGSMFKAKGNVFAKETNLDEVSYEYSEAHKSYAEGLNTYLDNRLKGLRFKRVGKQAFKALMANGNMAEYVRDSKTIVLPDFTIAIEMLNRYSKDGVLDDKAPVDMKQVVIDYNGDARIVKQMFEAFEGNKDMQDAVQLHEKVHAAVTDFMMNNPQNTLTINMLKLFKDTLEKAETTNPELNLTEYWKTDVHEFIAEALTNPMLVKELVNIQYDKKASNGIEKLLWLIAEMIAKWAGNPRVTKEDKDSIAYALLYNMIDIVEGADVSYKVKEAKTNDILKGYKGNAKELSVILNNVKDC